MLKTPTTHIPKPRSTKTPKDSTQVSFLSRSLKADSKNDPPPNPFADINKQRNARILHLEGKNIDSFYGLKNFPNARIINIQNNPMNASKMAVILAFRSLNIQTINGDEVTEEDIRHSFNYSGLVTYALRIGMDPSLVTDDPDETLKNALQFFGNQYPEQFTTESLENSDGENGKVQHKVEDQKITVNVKGHLYAWYVLNEEFMWKPIEGDTNVIINSLNFPLKCEIKNASPVVSDADHPQLLRSMAVYIQEIDRFHHVYAELSGNPVEGDILSVKAPLSSNIIWSHYDDESEINHDTLVLPLTPDDVGRVIKCEIIPGPDLPSTILYTNEVRPGEFRFKSLKLQGQLIENDEIEFDISTKGTRATFKGIRILRSARHGEWENVAIIEKEKDGKLKYQLTVQDIGCVIRAVCITEGGGPPLMLTSSERVQPSAPRFENGNIVGDFAVGMPIFAYAQYAGGIQGNCRYEWSIGDKNVFRPVIIPTAEDKGKKVSCKMTPVRSDGSIGRPILVESSKTISDSKKPLNEKFLAFHKRTRTGKLQMSFVNERPSEQLNVIHENETIIVSRPCDWAIIDSNGPKGIGESKIFTAEQKYIKKVVVVFTNDFFAIAGIVEAAPPSATNVAIECDKSSAFITVNYQYSGGTEGRSIIQWNRNDGHGEVVTAFGKSFHIGIGDRGCTFRAIVTPISLDGKRGTPTPSEPFLIDDSCIASDEKPVMTILPPDIVLCDTKVVLVFQEDPMPDADQISYAVTSLPITKRHKIVWKNGNRVIAEGNSITPTVYDLDKKLKVCVIDRIRKETLAECELPPVEADNPSVSNVQLQIEKKKNPEGKLVNKVTVQYTFTGGIEGNTIFVWKGIKPGETEPTECARNNRRWIEINESWDNAQIGVEVIPMNTSSETPGHSVESDFIKVPPLVKNPKQTFTVTKIDFVPNQNFTEINCDVKTSEECKITYDWGYFIDNSPQFLDETTEVHTIVEDDFEEALFCKIRLLNQKNEVIYDVNHEVPREIFNPLGLVAIKPADKKETTFMHGQELEIDFVDYKGPPNSLQFIIWERSVETNLQNTNTNNKTAKKTTDTKNMKRTTNYENCDAIEQDDEGWTIVEDPDKIQKATDDNKWKRVSENNKYTTTMNDFNHYLRAIVVVEARIQALHNPIYYKFTTSPVLIDGKNKIIRRMAKALKRTKRAVFDAKMQLGETVTVLFENGNVILKSGSTVLLRSPYFSVALDLLDSKPTSLILRARHGYNTELTFGERKMSGGYKFSAVQTRELFYRTLSVFQKTK